MSAINATDRSVSPPKAKSACGGVRPLALAGLSLAMILGACGERELILPGTRLDARAVTSPDGPAVEAPALSNATALRLQPARLNASWSQRAGNAAHAPGHVALSGLGRSVLWSASIGQGEDRRHRITADPVTGGGLVFAMDSRSRVTALTASGGTAWSVDIAPADEIGDSVSGGGLAYGDGTVFVTSGYGELVALDASTGGVRWRQRVGAPIGGAPVYAGGTVYVTGRNALGFAVEASNGKLKWQVGGTAGTAGVMGVSAPAVSGEVVVFPFASGQLLAVDTTTGIERWSAQVAGTRLGAAVANIRDLTGDPVIVGNTVYAGSSSGRINAFDLTTGETLWSARSGALSPVVVAGGAVFAVSDASRLVRLDAASGAQVWAVDLPEFTTTRVKRQDDVWVHYGPVLASGRLLVASSDGVMRIFDPATGALTGQGTIPSGAATSPSIANGAAYVSGRDGKLYALR